MTTTAARVDNLVAATAFVWLGMVAGVSFLEAPLKFRAPGITTQLGLGIGRLVFAALNRVELTLAVVLAVGLVTGRPTAAMAWSAAPRTRAHHAYVGLEVAKVLALASLGVSALGSR